MWLVLAGIVVVALVVVLMMLTSKAQKGYIENVVSLLHDDETKEEWTEADRQSTREYYKSKSSYKLRGIIRELEETR